MGPRTEPCGTPEKIRLIEEIQEPLERIKKKTSILLNTEVAKLRIESKRRRRMRTKKKNVRKCNVAETEHAYNSYKTAKSKLRKEINAAKHQAKKALLKKIDNYFWGKG